ncbi:peptidase T [Bombilactobacillus thymidiniphilus]|uniref:Peptidase T n=1 Tax=Bombilactobacillus thymidiniphilus TaxID=2923363 RepID=A0ABY4PDZ8_9LACO|nr:peptidase T [Bombilactobacillus thymidiniphilus]UQS84004.1 peptidase T [Bombilactobacillus thymidiniphilus]
MDLIIDQEQLLADFLQYVQIDTTSDAHAPLEQVPTTAGQTKLALILQQQLYDLGLQQVKLNPKNSFLTALLPSNNANQTGTIGFIAHLDTAPDYKGSQIHPQIHVNYDGSDIHWNNGLVLSSQQFPNLQNYIQQTLITTDGTTLLGVDDKGGIAGLVSALRYLVAHPEVEHCNIKVAFGPDEEIGRGADRFDVRDFAADFAYTLDNGLVGDIEYETFNAAQAVIEIAGTSVHPGQAKDQLVNAISLGEMIDQLLPASQRPELVDGHDGFYLLTNFSGTVAAAQLTYIIRDFARAQFEERKNNLQKIVDNLNQDLDYPRIKLHMADQYYNMADIINLDRYPLDLAQQAIEKLDIKPNFVPFRGGTDGSKITYLGLPTPNLFNGGENFHGPYEFVTVESLAQLAQTIVTISMLYNM